MALSVLNFPSYFLTHKMGYVFFFELVILTGEDIMTFYEYKGHTIYPTPRFNTVTNKWGIHLTIRCDNKFRIFTQDVSFNTSGEAVFNCINFGKKLIDEGIELSDL